MTIIDIAGYCVVFEVVAFAVFGIILVIGLTKEDRKWNR